MSSLKLAAVLTFALTATALAAEPPPSAQPTPDAAAAKSGKPAAEPKEKLICTRETLVGSTIPKRVCRTAEQVDLDRSKAQRAREDLRGADPDAPGAAGAH